MKVLTADQMREVDRRAIEGGIPGEVLMENAGRALADRCSSALVFVAMCVLPTLLPTRLPGILVLVLSGFARIFSSGIGLPGAVSVSA